MPRANVITFERMSQRPSAAVSYGLIQQSQPGLYFDTDGVSSHALTAGQDLGQSVIIYCSDEAVFGGAGAEVRVEAGAPMISEDSPVYVCHLCHNQMFVDNAILLKPKLPSNLVSMVAASTQTVEEGIIEESDSIQTNSDPKQGSVTKCDQVNATKDDEKCSTSKEDANLEDVLSVEQLLEKIIKTEEATDILEDLAEGSAEAAEDEQVVKTEQVDVSSGDESRLEQMNACEPSDHDYTSERRGHNRKSPRNRHLRNYKPNVKKDGGFMCCECGKVLSTRRQLYVHEKLHVEGKNHTCPVCFKFFNLESAWKKHVRSHSDSGQHYQCEVCPKRFPRQASLKVHMMNHTGQRSFLCPECGKGFKLNSELVRHMQMHNGKTICEICNRVFSTMSNLKNHKQKIHTENLRQTEACKVCGKHVVSYNIAKHMSRVHGEHEHWQCEVCQKVFHRKEYLDKHMKIHLQSELVMCPVCGKAFANTHYLKAHMKRHKMVLQT